MSTNKIDELTEREAKHLLNDICSRFQIGGKARTYTAIMTNVENAIRRSQCLSRIESLYTETVIDENGEEIEEKRLNWGDDPDQYLERFKRMKGEQ